MSVWASKMTLKPHCRGTCCVGFLEHCSRLDQSQGVFIAFIILYSTCDIEAPVWGVRGHKLIMHPLIFCAICRRILHVLRFHRQ